MLFARHFGGFWILKWQYAKMGMCLGLHISASLIGFCAWQIKLDIVHENARVAIQFGVQHMASSHDGTWMLTLYSVNIRSLEQGT